MYLYAVLEKKLPSDIARAPSDDEVDQSRGPPEGRVNEFVKHVKSMDDDAHETMYALIKYHHILNPEDDNTIYPYKIKNTPNSGIKIDFYNLPRKLQYILFEFATLNRQLN